MMTTMSSRIVMATAFAFVLTVPCRAQFVIGRYASEFMSLGAGARSLAMGDAAVASPFAPAAIYYNPSALAGLEKRHVEFMHASQFDNAYTYDYLSFVRPASNGNGVGLTALYTRVSDIPLTMLADPAQPISDNNRVLVRKKTGDHEIALLAGLGRNVCSWRAGASAKLLMKSVADESAFGLGFDFGFGKSVAAYTDVGLAVRDVTTSVLAWSTGRTEAILPSVALGGAHTFDIHAANARVSIAGELETHFESRGEAELVQADPLSVQPKVGLEYEIANTVALRGGLKGEDLTFGAGLRFAALNVGAAFQNHEDLGFTHRISAAFNW